MSVHQINTRIYYMIKIKVISPISVSNGENENTDSDVLVNGSGIPFIPGTSLAGAFRNYLGVSKDKDCIYGFSQSNYGRMSSIFISDLYFVDESKNLDSTGENNGVIKSIRDGVKLTDEKGVDNKFDMEIIEPGITGIIRMEIVKRDGDTYDYDYSVAQIFDGLQTGEIRLGSNKNRGMGRIKILKILEKSFSKENRDDWLTFCDGMSQNDESGYVSYEIWSKEKVKTDRQYIIVKTPLKLRGGISIRRYSAKPGKADYEHITSNGKPVIPGSSWNGAIRSDARRILKELGCSDMRTKELIDQWFGYVDKDKQEDENKKARQSMIVISESIIEDATAVPMTRNKIDRFTAGAGGGALYSEISYFGGTTDLEYMIKKDNERDYKALVGLMFLITMDIEKGYVSVGGQAGIGRGLFSGESRKEPYKDIDIDECLTDLYNVVS